MPVSSATAMSPRGLLGAEDDEVGDEREQRAERHQSRPRRPSAAAAARPGTRPCTAIAAAAASAAQRRGRQADRAEVREAQQRHQQRERGQRPRRRRRGAQRQQRRPRRGARGARQHQSRAEPPDRRGGEDDVDAVVLREPAGDLDRDHRRRQRRRQHAGERAQRGRVRAGGDRVAQPPRGERARSGRIDPEREQVGQRLARLVLGRERRRQRHRRDGAPCTSGITTAKAATASVTIRASVAPNGARWLGRGLAMRRQPYSWPASPPCDHSTAWEAQRQRTTSPVGRPLATAAATARW